MGTDIHVFFEKLHEEKIGQEIIKSWRVFPKKPTLDPIYWWESLVMGRKEVVKIQIEKAMLMFGCNDEDEALDKLARFYEKMPIEEANELFGDHPHVIKWWDIPYEVRSRDYQYFSALDDIKGRGENAHHTVSNDLGLPEDLCKEIKNQYIQEEGDAHSAGWVMLDELFLRLPKFRNVNMIKEYMENNNEYEYEKIRMVFWYDN